MPDPASGHDRENDKATQPMFGTQLVSYALGELDADSQIAVEERVKREPALREELEDIRAHMRLHQRIPKVAPRRGSFNRLNARMKRDGAFSGAIPGAHCMLRRSFGIAVVTGIAAIVLLLVFSNTGRDIAAPDVIGQIVYMPASGTAATRRVEVSRSELVLNRDPPYNTGEYEAFIWLPTGISGSSSTIEASPNTEFRFTQHRRVELLRGTLEHADIQLGGVGEGAFVVATPHCEVHVQEGGLTVVVTPDGAQTQVSVARGSARVFGLDSDSSVPVNAGYFTTTRRDRPPDQAKPVLRLTISVVGQDNVLEARMYNDGFTNARIRRAIDSARVFAQPMYMLHVSYVADHEPGTTPENVTLRPFAVTPLADALDHSGETWLSPTESYNFRFSIAAQLSGAARVPHWLRLEYNGDLYGPAGEARIRVQSTDLKIEPRTR
jgi:hypothetical protein